jgi:hypothetical protein
MVRFCTAYSNAVGSINTISNRMNSQAETPKYGARVYRLAGKLLVKQTVLRGTPPEYVIDEQRERHVPEDDDKAIATAVRDAVSGRI